MSVLGRFFLGVWGIASTSFWIVFCGSGYILGSPFDRSGAWMDFWQRLYMGGVLLLMGVRMKVEGRENIPRRDACIVMANHRSYLDIPASVMGLRPLSIRFVAKRELARVPFLGWALSVSHHILIDRGDREQAIRALKRARTKMSGGVGLSVFPEGTRSPETRLLPFKKGGFHLAIQGGFPILPVSIRGSQELLGKRNFLPRPGVITLVVHPLVLVEGKSRNDVLSLAQEVRRVILSGLPDAREAEPPPSQAKQG